MSALVGLEDESGQPSVSLPANVRLRREVGETIETRRSSRIYTGDTLPLSYIATLVRHGSAITAWEEVDLLRGGREFVGFRTAPSGGALYPIEMYVLPLRIEGLKRRVYRYSPRSDALIEGGDESRNSAVVSAFAVPEELISIGQAAAVFLLVGRPWRSMRKYGSRGGRYLLIEAGAIAQNIHLSAHALGLGSVACASVYDDEVHDGLRIDGLFECLLHAIIVGQPA
jgi:SagB-type dehydrogenase family enzyme